MGEVYRARDTRLDRHVALKFLLEDVFTDTERTLRFEREARTLAALNHPNIATLHGIEQVDGRHFLVMELVDGETLHERIARSPDGLPLADALAVARQICGGLEAAHEKGIVHRDLKPANVKITPDGKVKILDFGLARISEPDAPSPANPAHSPTMTAMATRAGVILGTASYMSPEQARGAPADHRSDIFAFGIVLYEMLTGRQPFPGQTISDVLASILAREPDLAALAADLSPRLRELLRRLLDKNPKARPQHIGDVRYEVESILANPRATSSEIPGPAATRVPASWWHRVVPLAVTALGTALVVGGGAWLSRPTDGPAPPVARFDVLLPEGQLLPWWEMQPLAVAPDGTSFAYFSNRQLFVRPMATLVPKLLFENETRMAVGNLVFSPDGLWVAFSADGTIHKVHVAGGTAVVLDGQQQQPLGMSWAGDSLLFGFGRWIYRLPAAGGKPEALIELADGELAASPQMLPDGRTILFTVVSNRAQDGWDSGEIVAQRLGETTRTSVQKPGAAGLYVASGYLLFAQRGTVFARPFNPIALRASGEAVRVVEGVRRGSVSDGFGSAQLTVSDNGVLVYVPGPVAPSPTPRVSIAAFDRAGETAFRIPPGPYSEPRMSRDGGRIAFGSNEKGDTSISIFDVRAGGAPRRLTFGGRDRYPVWSPDGRWIAFQSDRDGATAVYRQAADGSGATERLTSPGERRSHLPLSWSPDGDVLLVEERHQGQRSLMILTIRDRRLEPFGNVRSSTTTGAVFSPDGRWVAYSVRSPDASSNIVYVQPYPATGALFQVSKNSEDGHHPVWSPDGNELYYTPGPGALITAVPVSTKPAFSMGEPVVLPRTFNNDAPSTQTSYDIIAPRRFLGLMSEDRSDNGDRQLHVVLNWFDELIAKVPAQR
jgi:serine/threonine-protein kinase